MAKRFPSSRQRQQRESAAKQTKKDLAKLRKLGLYEPKGSAVTAHGKSIIRKYRDVLSGRATIVRAKPSKTESAKQRAREYKGTFRVRGDKIIVSHPPTSKPRFSAKTGEITIDVKNVGQIKRGRLTPFKINSIDDLRRINRDGFYFGMPFKRFGSGETDWLQYDDVEELINDMAAYPSYKNWATYVVLIPKTSKTKGQLRTLDDALEDE